MHREAADRIASVVAGVYNSGIIGDIFLALNAYLIHHAEVYFYQKLDYVIHIVSPLYRLFISLFCP